MDQDDRHLTAGLRTGRQPAIGAHGIVVSPNPFATLTGIDVLRSGGNAVDAALAVSAALMVSVPHQCGPGGDAWWMVRPPGGPAEVLNATGRSSRHASSDELRGSGWRRVADRHVHAVTAPAVVAGWLEVQARWGSRALTDLFAPAVAAAEEGLAISPYMARQLVQADELLARDEHVAAIFRPGGRRLRVGDRLVQVDLAASLRELASDPRSIFEGRLADGIVSTMREHGGWLDGDDLASVSASWERPLSTPFGGWSVLEAPPNSQGVTALIGLAIHDRVREGLAQADAATDLHVWVESARLSMAVRDAAIADPGRMGYEPSRLLEPATIALLAEAVDPARAAPQERLTTTADAVQARLRGTPRGTPPPASVEVNPDTAHFVVVDADGFVVSVIQSLFSGFGSGIVVPGTGILLHNRGVGFSLEEGHPNELRPGQRPMHTLAPAMALAGDRVTAAFGCMGGYAQAQLHLQMVQGLAGDGLDPATVTARPRWFARPDPVTGAPEVLVEDRLDEAADLASLGHVVVRVGPYDEVVGHEQIVLVDEARGALLGAADPRSDGIALAY